VTHEFLPIVKLNLEQRMRHGLDDFPLDRGHATVYP
jgi:hypothetical protein